MSNRVTAIHTSHRPKAVVIGAGMGGLTAALRLAHAGCAVTVIEAQNTVGGKMRTVPSAAGPVDAGPTVVTMRPVFEKLFSDLGTDLKDHVHLTRLETLARHFWPDGSTLDLYDDIDASAAAIAQFAGAKARSDFLAFHRDSRALFTAFEGPMIRSPDPSQMDLTLTVLRSPHILRAMAPHQNLAQSLSKRFGDPRLAQLFGRYSTYIGGNPYLSPALLALIWASEAAGVWRVEGGVHQLALAMQKMGTDLGIRFLMGTSVERLHHDHGRVHQVALSTGEVCAADVVLFNGDPRAIHIGLLGTDLQSIVPRQKVEPRSLSAHVWSFASRVSGRALAHHNVFFGADPRSEFDPIAAGEMPRDPTLYVCAQDAGLAQDQMQRFEIIMNGAPSRAETKREVALCRDLTFQTLAARGLTFQDPIPDGALTSPMDFAEIFPASRGSLYGRSPHGLTAGLKRPRARTALKGLYLAGGGTHPGAGIPMACLSGQHAAEAILTDLVSTSPFRPMATRGGILTA